MSKVWSDKTRIDLLLAILLNHPPGPISWNKIAETTYGISPELNKDKPSGNAMRQVYDKIRKGKGGVEDGDGKSLGKRRGGGKKRAATEDETDEGNGDENKEKGRKRVKKEGKEEINI